MVTSSISEMTCNRPRLQAGRMPAIEADKLGFDQSSVLRQSKTRRHTVEKYRSLFINGEWVEPAAGKTGKDINPATGEVAARVALAGKEDIDRAVSAAQRAYDDVWFDTPAKERGAMLLKLADTIEEHADEMARLECIDIGQPISLARMSAGWTADTLRFFAGCARTPGGMSVQEFERGFTSMLRREPLGVTAGICPWNFPILMAGWKIGPALAAGNTSIIKPSSESPLTALYLAELAADILPAGVLNVVTGPGAEIGEAICRHPDVRLVSMTGDVDTGRRIAAACADTVTRCHLELGGKAPVIVFDDADLEAFATCVKAAGYDNSGQDCSAACRVLAASSIYDDLLAHLVPAVESIKVGDPQDPDIEMGPVVSAGQQKSVKGYVDRARSDGATICVGGEVMDRAGFYYQPTVVADPDQKSEIVQEEVFGPVVTVQRFSDEDQAVAWANDTIYGLTSAVWTKDLGRALRVSRRLRFGCVWVNTHMMQTNEMPHGGFKQSGYGSDMSKYAFEEYTQLKHVAAALG